MDHYKLIFIYNSNGLQGAFWSLIAGMITGLIRMVLDFVYVEPMCGEEDTRPTIVKDVRQAFSIVFNHLSFIK